MGVSRTSNRLSTDDLIDRAGALSWADGDRELMVNLVDIFLGEVGPVMQAIRSAVASNDPGKVERSAHRLKGSLNIFCAETVSETALALEHMGRAGDLTEAAETLARLEEQIVKLRPVLQQFRNELQSMS